MSKKNIVTIGQTPEGGEVRLDIQKLVRARLGLAANSGGGKSHAFRLIGELTAGILPRIFLDREGEFVTLRQTDPDILIVGDGGELATDLKTAGLLARKLVQNRLSAVINLYDMKPDARRKYVQLFLDSVMALGKKDWHPTLFFIDEAHYFCPERGEVESSEAVITLMSQGRKRGFAGVLATQRLSKLHKDALAETNNMMLGRVSQDVDQKRHADLLGIATKQERLDLRLLKPGQFYVYGPAFLGVEGQVLMRTGMPQTEEPPTGADALSELPPASKAMEKTLAQLGDLPAQAQEEEDYVVRLEGQIADLEKKLATADKARPAVERVEVPVEKVVTKVERVEVPVLDAQAVAGLQILATRATDLRNQADDLLSATQVEMLRVKESQAAAKEARGQTVSVLVSEGDMTEEQAAKLPTPKIIQPAITDNGQMVQHEISRDDLKPAEVAILTLLAQYHPEALDRERISLMSGYSIKSSSFSGAIHSLKQQGLASEGDAGAQITEIGRIVIGEVEPLPTGQQLIQHWMGKLSNYEANLFKAILAYGTGGCTRELIADATGYSETSSSFSGGLYKLRQLRLIQEKGGSSGVLKANDEFLEGRFGA